MVRFPRGCRGPLARVGGVERSGRNVGAPRHAWLDQVCPSAHKEDGKGWRGSRITPEYLESGRAAHRGKGVTVGRSPHRQLVPDMEGRSTQANLPEGNSHLLPGRSAEARLIEEPGAEKPHAGICAGGVG